MADRPAEGTHLLLQGQAAIHYQEVTTVATKAQEVYEKVNALMEGGMSRPDAFKKLAEEYKQPVNSLRGSYYSFSRGATGDGNGKSRPRRRETTADDALADARAALERAMESIDREVETAKTRADEAKAEYEDLKASASDRKKAIADKLAALES
jgi:chromosome segregation ATPase